MRGGGSPQGRAPHITDSQAVRGESAYEILKMRQGHSTRSALLSSSETDTRGLVLSLRKWD